MITLADDSIWERGNIRMKKVLLTAICIISIITYSVAVTGCGSIDNSNISEDQSSAINKTNETSMPTGPGSPQPGDDIKAIDYNRYLKKIWVVKDWDGGAYKYPSSFFISKIENGAVEGKLITRSVAEPEFYFFRLEPSKYLGDLSGIVNKERAVECQFSDEVGNKGNVTLAFKENDEIEATIKYTGKGDAYKDLPLDGNYVFRPYNLADIKGFTPLKEHSFAIDLNSWGSVNFVSGEVNTGNKVYPLVYLTNGQDDILYEFRGYFHTGSKIIETSVTDINKDGLKDITIITRFNDPAIEHIKWVFYQMDNGLFYDSDLDAN